jgi:flagellar protein FlbT
MSNLVLELRQGEVMIVNGAPIRFRTKTRIELTAKARFLFGKQIMAPNQADSPARRIYFALQAAYIGAEDERGPSLSAARDLIAAFKEATTSASARDMLDRALEAAEADDCYRALKLVRRIIRHEDAVLGRPELGHAEPGHAEPGHAEPGHAELGHADPAAATAASPSAQTIALTAAPASVTSTLVASVTTARRTGTRATS